MSNDRDRTIRSHGQIMARIKFLQENNKASYCDFFGAQRSDLLDYLPFHMAESTNLLKYEITAEYWKSHNLPFPRDHESIKAKILDYMPFAWEKANDCRWLSAQRSLDHMKAWFWMLRHDVDLWPEHSHYGKPHLRAICEHFEWDWTQWDDGDWRQEEFHPPVTADQVPSVASLLFFE